MSNVSAMKCTELRMKTQAGSLDRGDKITVLSVVEQCMALGANAPKHYWALVGPEGLGLIEQQPDVDGPRLETTDAWLQMFDDIRREVRIPGEYNYHTGCPACRRRVAHTDEEHEANLDRVCSNSMGDYDHE